MFKIIESEHSGKEYVADRDIHTCNHKFERIGRNIRCKFCHVGYLEDPANPFPVDEINAFFDNPRNQEYFKTNTP